jgi:hypothetical protein
MLVVIAIWHLDIKDASQKPHNDAFQADSLRSQLKGVVRHPYKRG